MSRGAIPPPVEFDLDAAESARLRERISSRTAAITIPLRALPDDGAQIMSYFEDRLVATRVLRRSSSLTTIVNTTSP